MNADKQVHLAWLSTTPKLQKIGHIQMTVGGVDKATGKGKPGFL